MFHSWNQAFRIIGFLGRSPNINPAWCWEQREVRLTWPYNVLPAIRRPGFMIITPSLSSFSVVFSNQKLSNSSSTMDVGFMKLSSNSFWGNTVFEMNIEFCCHLCCSSSMILTQSSSIYGDPFHLVLVFGHCPSQPMSSMICVGCHNIGNCCSR